MILDELVEADSHRATERAPARLADYATMDIDQENECVPTTGKHCASRLGRRESLGLSNGSSRWNARSGSTGRSGASPLPDSEDIECETVGQIVLRELPDDDDDDSDLLNFDALAKQLGVSASRSVLRSSRLRVSLGARSRRCRSSRCRVAGGAAGGGAGGNV